jgi:hypothetical protein
MRYLLSSTGGHTLVTLKLASFQLSFSLQAMVRSLLLFLTGLTLVTPSVRTALRHAIKDPLRLIVLIFSLGYLAFTLKPTPNGWGIVLYLIFGSVGTFMLFVGISPLLERLIEKASPIAGKIADRFNFLSPYLIPFTFFLLPFIGANLISYFIFEHIPHIQDSIDQVFHGKIFLLGRLTVPSPEPREFFDFTHMINNGRWYSQYPPGHSFLMSIGHIFHAPWLINPLFGALCVMLLYFVGREIYDERTGRLAALLGAISPFLLFMSGEFMNHPTTLFFVELFLLGLARMIRRGRMMDSVLCGFGLGYALNIRPMTAVAVGAPFALYAFIRLIRLLLGRRRAAVRFGLLCLTALAVFGTMCGILLTFNYLTNGDPLLFGYTVLHGEGHGVGFGRSGWGEPHTPRKGLIQTLNNLNALNKYLFEMPIPSLLFALLALTSPMVKVWDLLLLGYASSLALAYFFYWFQDWCFGPRFMFESAAAFILLTARGLMGLPKLMHLLFGIRDERKVKGYVAVILSFCLAVGLASNLPTLVRIYSNSYWGVNRDVLKAVERMGIKNAVVFVRSYYGSVFAANSPTLDGEVIYVKDLGDERNKELMRRFPDRRFYRADGAEIKPY